MILRRFYISLIIRISLILLNVFLIFHVIENPKHIFSIGISISFFLIQVIFLVKFFNKTNQDLANFLLSVLYKDGTFKLPENAIGSSKKQLDLILNSIIADLKKSRIETEKQYSYLKNIIEHVDTGIVVFDGEGRVDLVNNSALSLFKVKSINTIKELDAFYKGFSNILLDLLPNIPRLITVKILDEDHFISLRASVFKLEEKSLRLVSFHEINEEMNETEIKSWEKLIRVLTHEIMNSVSPISSLTTTITRIFKPNHEKKAITELNESDIDDAISGLGIIQTRSQGLIDFIKKYRKVHLMPKAVFENFELFDVLQKIKELYKNEIDKLNIDCKLEVYPENLTVNADKAMIEQVVINLLKNAIEVPCKQNEKVIKIKGFKDSENNVSIEISDNGTGIPDDIKDDIFVPFFSTKESGSGIGLSLVRQLAFINKATLNMKSDAELGTKFLIVFKN